ncbi:MAG: MaoC family dehydratase N-terminal domain-containing protein [Deltaproteobacteria bacterium]|nr:MaoC family dehydratase N-terminal domain-containing protein [Deltaproteobacteria bacterium]
MNSQKKYTLEQLNSLIGQEIKVGYPTRIEVEKGAVKNFAEAIRYAHPLYVNEAYARSKGYRSVIAPPTFAAYDYQRGDAVRSVPLPFEWSGLHGGDEWKFIKDIQAGDVLTPTVKLADISLKEGKKGQIFLLKVEITYTNQDNEIVAIYRSTTIVMPKEGQ